MAFEPCAICYDGIERRECDVFSLVRSTSPLAFSDKQIICRDCSKPFVFTGGEQEFYANKGLMNEPTRCPSCRTARRATQSTLQQDDGYVKYGNFASFGGKTPRQMHPAQCATCDQMTEVPFVPRGDRPVYCSNCYNKIKPAVRSGEPAF